MEVRRRITRVLSAVIAGHCCCCSTIFGVTRVNPAFKSGVNICRRKVSRGRPIECTCVATQTQYSTILTSASLGSNVAAASRLSLPPPPPPPPSNSSSQYLSRTKTLKSWTAAVSINKTPPGPGIEVICLRSKRTLLSMQLKLLIVGYSQKAGAEIQCLLSWWWYTCKLVGCPFFLQAYSHTLLVTDWDWDNDMAKGNTLITIKK